MNFRPNLARRLVSHLFQPILNAVSSPGSVASGRRAVLTAALVGAVCLPAAAMASTATTTALTATPTRSTYGAVVTLTATVSPSTVMGTAATGTVTFLDGAVTLGSGTISSGVASLAATGIPVGTDSVTAVYSGDSNFGGSTAPAILVAVVAPTTAVGATSPTEQVQFNFTSTVTLNSTLATAIQVVSQGASNLDYKYVSGGSCAAGATYTNGQSCTVAFSFTPIAPGNRLGAVVLFNNAATPVAIATNYFNGIGTSALGIFQTPVATTISSTLSQPRGVSIDAAGNVYIVETNSNTVDKFTPAGVETQYTLPSSPGGTGGTAVDGAGNLYVSNNANSTIYEIAAGTSTPVAIASVPGPDDNLVADNSGNLFMSSYSNNNIYEVAANTRTVSVIVNAGSTVTGGTTGRMIGEAIDGANNLYLTDFSNNRLYEVNALTFAISTIVNSDAYLNEPHSIAIDAAGNLYVANYAGSAYLLRYPYTGGTYGAAEQFPNIAGSVGAGIDGSGTLYLLNGSDLYKYARNATPAIAFPSTAVGATSAQSLEAFENDGNETLTLSSLTSTNSNFLFAAAADGSYAACGSTLASAGVCGLGVTFAPETAGTLSGNGDISDNTLNGSVVQQIPFNGTATIGTKTITFPQPPSQAAGTSYTLTATASDGDPVTYAITGGTATATLSGNVVTYLTAGTVQITASSAATANATAATPVIDTVTVTAAAVDFTAPGTAVGTTSATQTLEVTFTTAGTPGTISVVTQGLTGYDYAYVSGGTCSATKTYTAGESCSVEYTFTPETPGLRKGAAVIKNSGGTVLGMSYISGTGTGPQALYQPGTLKTTYSTTLNTARGLSVDPAGNVYVANYGANTVLKFPAGSTTPTTLATLTGEQPTATAVDGAGNVFVAATNGVYEIVGGTGTPVEINSQFDADDNLSVDGVGNLYTSDENTGAIYELPATGYATATTLIAGNATPLRRFVGMTIDGSGNLFAVDYDNNILYEVVAGSGALTKLASNAPLASPHSVAVDAAGDVYVGNYTGTDAFRYAAGNYSATPVTLNVLGQFSMAIGADGSLYSLTGATAGNTTLAQYSRVTAPALSFPTATAAGSIDTTDGTLPVTFENDGNAALSIASIAVSNGNFTFAGVANGSTAACGALLTSGGQCSLGATFTPQSAGGLSANGIVTDNSLYVTGATQSIPLTGVGTNAQPTVTAVSPTSGPVTGGTTVTITGTNLDGVTLVSFGATSASSFTIVSSTQITAVSPAHAQGTVDITVANSTYTSATSAADHFTFLNTDTVTWTPGSAVGYLGVPIGTGVLDATSTTPGTITYTATNASNVTVTITSASTLPAGVYTLTATLTPTSNTYETSSVTFSFTVINQEVFVANTAGTETSYYHNGAVETSSTTGGGIGAAVDASGYVWSIKSGGTSVTKFTDADAVSATYSGAGISAATALTVDGNGVVWIANSTSVSALTNAGAAVSTTAVAKAGNISTPNSITVDAAGSLWLANKGNNTVTEVIGVAAPVITPTVEQVIGSDPGTRP